MIAGVHIWQYQRLEYRERSVVNIKMRFGLAVCAIPELDPFEMVPWFPEEWPRVPLEDEERTLTSLADTNDRAALLVRRKYSYIAAPPS